jgi:hypothetical protein
MTVIVDHSGELKSVHRYGCLAFNTDGNIVAINGMRLKVKHLPEQKGKLSDYFMAWVNGVQSDGETHNEAVKNALKTKNNQQGS